MTNAPTALLVAVAYAGIVVLSMPLALLSFLLAPRRRSFAAALAQVGAVTGLVVVGGLAVAAISVSPRAALWLGVVTAAEAVVLVGFPLVIGRAIVRRRTGCHADEGLEFATLGLPSALFLSMLIVLLPGGSPTATLATLRGPAAIAAWSAFVLVVSFGPGLVGVGLYRLFERLG